MSLVNKIVKGNYSESIISGPIVIRSSKGQLRQEPFSPNMKSQIRTLAKRSTKIRDNLLSKNDELRCQPVI